MTESTDTNLINPEKSPPEKPPSNLFARITGIDTGWIRSLLLPTLALLVALILGRSSSLLRTWKPWHCLKRILEEDSA